jgi:hypothetical protein
MIPAEKILQKVIEELIYEKTFRRCSEWLDDVSGIRLTESESEYCVEVQNEDGKWEVLMKWPPSDIYSY